MIRHRHIAANDLRCSVDSQIGYLGTQIFERLFLFAVDLFSCLFRCTRSFFARQFRDADEILVAAPFWDLSFPSILKVYLEHVSVCDITFGYASDGSSVGYCKAKRLLYFSSCGGFVGAEHLGFAYVQAFAEMMGIHDCEAYTLEGMDIDPSKRKDLLEHAIAAL